ncbi:hypothetical protein EXS74_02865 [Candidatus Woesearchaeota archaeon]|nr:hypothetical protein [Candidatus Woesearchaeota archaeon]
MTDITPSIAELAGLFAADGSMQKNHLCYWGNIIEDREFYNTVVSNLFREAFKIKVKPHEKVSNSVYGFYVCNKEVLKFYNISLEFPIGSKTYTVTIPKKILASRDKRVHIAFIRGFFAGDGCLSFDKRYGACKSILKEINTYPRIQINSASHEIIRQISQLLSQLEIKHFVDLCKKKKENEVDVLRVNVYGKERLEDWKLKIGFSNANHQTKYEIFKKYGFVPPRITLQERQKILVGRCDPRPFYPTVSFKN